jgi:quercetin dioxygenase-like cupin family protein
MKEIRIEEKNWIIAQGYKKQILASEEVFKTEGVLAQVVIIGPGNTVEPHYHKQTYEFYYVISGFCNITINGNELELREGDMMMTEPGDMHSVHNGGDNDFAVLVFKSNAHKDDTFWQDA